MVAPASRVALSSFAVLVLLSSPARGAEPCQRPDRRDSLPLQEAAQQDEMLALALEKVAQSCAGGTAAACSDATEKCNNLLTFAADNAQRHDEARYRTDLTVLWFGQTYVTSTDLPPSRVHGVISCRGDANALRSAATERRQGGERHKLLAGEYERWFRWVQDGYKKCQADTLALERAQRAREEQARMEEEQRRLAAEAAAQREAEQRAAIEEARKEAERKAAEAKVLAEREAARKKELAEKLRKEAEVKAREELARKEQLAREEAEKQRKAQEEAARLEKDRKEKEERAKRDAAEKAKRAEQERLAKEEKLRREAEERQRREMEEAQRKAKQEQEEQARRAEAERRAKEQAEEAAQREAAKQLQEALVAQEAARREAAERQLAGLSEAEKQRRLAAQAALEKAKVEEDAKVKLVAGQRELDEKRLREDELVRRQQEDLKLEQLRKQREEDIARAEMEKQTRVAMLEKDAQASEELRRQQAEKDATSLAREEELRRAQAEKTIEAVGPAEPRSMGQFYAAGVGSLYNPAGGTSVTGSDRLAGVRLGVRHTFWNDRAAKGFTWGVELHADGQYVVRIPRATESSFLVAVPGLRVWLGPLGIGFAGDYRRLAGTDTTRPSGSVLAAGPEVAIAFVDSEMARVALGARWLPLLSGGAFDYGMVDLTAAYGVLNASLEVGTLRGNAAFTASSWSAALSVGLRARW